MHERSAVHERSAGHAHGAGHERSPVPAPPTRGTALARRWLALFAALAVLHLCGRGALARPSLGPILPGRAGAPPQPALETAMAALRLAALGAGGYLLLIVTVALIGRSLGHRPTVLLATRLTPPDLRAVLALATTAGLTVGLTGPIADAAGSPRPPSPTAPTLRWTAPPARPTAPTLRWTAPPARPALAPTLHWTAPPPRPAVPPTLHWTGPAAVRPAARPAASASSTESRPADRAAAPPRHPSAAAASGAGRSFPTPPYPRRRPAGARVDAYIVRPGDNFWSIAAAQLSVRGPVTSADDERVAHYWRLLVQANRRNLPVPGQPDLLFPGDRIALPPVS